jgi:hypothetical protein
MDDRVDKMPVANPELENPTGKEERTLTDHLNKKLLESFLSRMDAGTTGFPNLPKQSPKEQASENEDFD